MLSLSSGEFMGKDTGVESKSMDSLYATFLHFGQPLVYKSMTTKNSLRNEGVTNRYLPLFVVRTQAQHAEAVNSDDDDDDDDDDERLGSVPEVRGALPLAPLHHTHRLAAVLSASVHALSRTRARSPSSSRSPLAGTPAVDFSRMFFCHKPSTPHSLAEQVLAAIAFRALYQACVLPSAMGSDDVRAYEEAHPSCHRPTKEVNGKVVQDGPLQLSSMVFEALDGAGRDSLRAEFAEVSK